MASSQSGNTFSSADHVPNSEASSTPAPDSPAVTKKHRKLRAIRCDNSSASCRNCDAYHVVCAITHPDGSVFFRSSGRPSHPKARDSWEPPKTRERHTPIPQRSTFAKIRGTTERDNLDRNEFATRDPKSQDSDENFASPSNNTVVSVRSDVLEGVVVIEAGNFPQRNKFAGMSSGQVLAKSAEELFKDSVSGIDVMKFFCPLMDQAEETPLPPLFLQPLVKKEIADGQIDVFFSTTNILFPVFDESDFRRKYESFYSEGFTTNAGTAACIYMAIALGVDGSITLREVQTTHFQATWSLIDRLIACPYLPSIQALILLTLDLMSARRDGQAILIIGSAIRIAQSLGFHRKLAVRIHPHEKEFMRQNHYRRSCIWWICYCLDKKLCLEGGRPSIINDDDCDADLPEVALGPGSPSDCGQSVDRCTFLGYFISLCQILSSISSRLFGRAVSHTSESAILEQVEATDQTLLHFKASLPAELQPDQDLTGLGLTPNLVGANLLHCIYHNAMLTIHRAAVLGSITPEMRMHLNPRIVTSESICLGAARSLARSVNNLVHSSSAWMIPRMTMSYTLNAVFTLYIGIMKSPDRWSCESDLALIKSMRGCLFKIELHQQTLHDFDILLDSLCRAVETAQSTSGFLGSQNSLTISGFPRGSNFNMNNLGERADEATGNISDLQSKPNEQGGQGGSGDFDLRFVDFFGDDFGPLNFQWPTGMEASEETQLPPSDYRSATHGWMDGQPQVR